MHCAAKENKPSQGEFSVGSPGIRGGEEEAQSPYTAGQKSLHRQREQWPLEQPSAVSGLPGGVPLHCHGGTKAQPAGSVPHIEHPIVSIIQLVHQSLDRSKVMVRSPEVFPSLDGPGAGSVTARGQ